MSYIIFKYLITAALIVLISELAKFSDKIGAFTSALPLVTITFYFGYFLRINLLKKLQITLTILFGMYFPHFRCFSFFHGLSSIGHFGLPYYYRLGLLVILFFVYVARFKKVWN